MNCKKLLFVFLLFSTYFTRAQLSGGFESNSSLYIDDSKIKLEEIEARQRFRSNNYLRIDYKLKKFTAGAQLESYEPKALLNYSPELDKTHLGTYFINYRNEKIRLDVTAGHFYDQFGSGLVLRSWEDRQLGIANSIVGGMIKYSPVEPISITALYGKQRNGIGFNFTDGKIGGLNTDIVLSSLFKAQKVKFGLGFSYVNRNEEITGVPGLKDNTYLTSVRGDFSKGGFTTDFEYAFKSTDALVEYGRIRPELPFDGDAYLFNIGYSKSGFGINANFRRLENFSFYSQRNLAGNVYNQGIVNYIPALTKQYDYSLTNIYVYSAQPGLSFEPDRNKAGEIGWQIDLFFKFKKESFLGGKYGTNVSVNYAQWYGLKGRYDASERKYKADLFASGQKYYRDASIEIRKKWSNKWSSVITYLNQYYNSRYVLEETGEVNANTVVIDNTHKLTKSKSIRWELQHQWADASYKNWAASLLEFNFNSVWSVFAMDLYNYGNDVVDEQLHFYNFGASFNKGSSRVQLSYGRQRGGLICVGGVCRFVPQSAGLNLNVNFSF
ncbi:MAG TPA: DUF6029 family protein [Chitinophagaceae bacterium]|nr:DUF6029 family protein [Chitinophagaceae bacterium]